MFSPAIGAIAAIVLAASILRHNDYWPFYWVATIFVSAFGTLAFSFWPYKIPFAITIDEAAAPHSSLANLFWAASLLPADVALHGDRLPGFRRNLGNNRFKDVTAAVGLTPHGWCAMSGRA